jgi:hypothetical protein
VSVAKKVGKAKVVYSRLSPHGQEYVEVEQRLLDTPGQWTQSTQVNRPPGLADGKRPIDYFLLNYPPSQWGSHLRATNAQAELELGINWTPSRNVTLAEFKKVLGIRIVTCIDPQKGKTQDAWKEEDDPHSTMQARKFGSRFNISKNRFVDISRWMRLTAPIDPDDDIPLGERVLLNTCF